MTQGTEWVSTGKAAALLGYNRDAFRRKFFEAFQRERAVIRQPGGHCRWLLLVVIRLRDGSEDLQDAG